MSNELPEGTDLFRGMAGHDYGSEEMLALNIKVWGPTPWMVDVYTGGYSNSLEREQKIREWCAAQFGPESSPIHGRVGTWHRGGATINGWTWMGFATREQMEQFMDAWPTPVEPPTDPAPPEPTD